MGRLIIISLLTVWATAILLVSIIEEKGLLYSYAHYWQQLL